jgi:hypothetical protein
MGLSLSMVQVMNLGRVGLWAYQLDLVPSALAQETAAEIEDVLDSVADGAGGDEAAEAGEELGLDHGLLETSLYSGIVELLADEQKATTVGFLARAVGWFSEQGITSRRVLSDNGPSYRSGDWRKACRALDLKPIRTKPYTPQTNGKAERFIKTLLAEWAYVIPYQTSAERNHWLPRYLGIYNDHRCHMALGGLTPQQYLQRLLIAE